MSLSPDEATAALSRLDALISRGDLASASALSGELDAQRDALDDPQREELDRLSGLLRPHPLALVLTGLTAALLGVIAGLLYLR